MFILIIVAICGGEQAFAQQQGNIKGRVFDKKNNDPLESVSVTIRDSNKSTTTDKDGKYEFKSLNANRNYTLDMKLRRYKNDSTMVNVKANQDNEANDVKLEPKELLGNIKGKVFDKKSNNPLPNATVNIRSLNKTTPTDKDGKYEFRSLEADKDYTLDISRVPLYKDGSTTVNVKPDQDNNADGVGLEYNGPNARALGELVQLYNESRYEEFGIKLNLVVAWCAGVKQEDCKLIERTNKVFDKRGFLATSDSIKLIEKLMSQQSPR